MNWNYFTFAKSHAGKVRPYNEDALLDMTEQHIWVVADGMGGHSAGDIASQMLVDRVARHMQDVSNTNIDDIRRVVQEANLEIYQYAQNHLDGKTMGTTLVLLFIQDGYYHCLWVGDSRIYQLRSGNFVQKTRDHSQVMDLVDQAYWHLKMPNLTLLQMLLPELLGSTKVSLLIKFQGSWLMAISFYSVAMDSLRNLRVMKFIGHCMQTQSTKLD